MPKVMQYTKGSIVYFEGDNDERVFILQKGAVVLSSVDIENGSPINDTVKVGEFFGVKSALGRFPREETVRVLVDSTAVAMTVAEFEQLFGSNKTVILKMLQVFSNQLRGIHNKIKSILNNKTDISPEDGMFAAAQSFYSDSKFKTCADICEHYLNIFPRGIRINDVNKLLENAKKRANPPQQKNIQASAPAEALSGAMKQFSLPMFERFAKKIPAGGVIIAEFEPGNTFYLIQSGQVQLVKTVNGSNKNLDVLHSGEFFGEMAILENSPRSATCVAIDEVQVLEFNKANFEALIAGNPQIALILLKLFCKRIYDQRRRFKILGIQEPQTRLCDVFLMLDEARKEPSVDERERKFTTTVSDIAHWAGLPVPNVQDELSQMVKRGRIQIFDKYIIVNNIIEMRRVVDQKRQVARPQE